MIRYKRKKKIFANEKRINKSNVMIVVVVFVIEILL